MALARLYNFTSGTTIASAQVNAEFNQLVNALNGSSLSTDIVVQLSSGTLPPIRTNQQGAGPLATWSQAGSILSFVANDGGFQGLRFISTISTGQAPFSCASTTVCANLNADMVDGKGVPSTFVAIAGTLAPVTTTSGNSAGSGDTDLHSKTLAANTFAANGDTLEVVMGGTIAANSNAKRLRLYFGGTVILDTGSTAALNNLDWRAQFTVTRLDSDSVKVLCTLTFNSNTFETQTNYSQIDSLNFASTLIVKAVGNGVGASDVVQELSTFTLIPGA